MDKNATGFRATVSVTIQPVNRYGDILEDQGGTVTFIKRIPDLTLVEIAEKLAVLDS